MFSRSLFNTLVLSIFALAYLTAANPAFMVPRRSKAEISSHLNPSNAQGMHNAQAKPLKQFNIHKQATSTRQRRNLSPSFIPIPTTDDSAESLPDIPASDGLDVSVDVPGLISASPNSISNKITLPPSNVDTSKIVPLSGDSAGLKTSGNSFDVSAEESSVLQETVDVTNSHR